MSREDDGTPVGMGRPRGWLSRLWTADQRSAARPMSDAPVEQPWIAQLDPYMALACAMASDDPSLIAILHQVSGEKS